jgi:hypothetical protein
MARPLIGERPLTAAERQRRRRDRLAGRLAPWQPVPKPSRPQFDPDSPFIQGLKCIDDLFDKLPGAADC